MGDGVDDEAAGQRGEKRAQDHEAFAAAEEACAEENREGCAEDGGGGNAQREGADQDVSGDGLHDGPGDRQPRAGEDGEGDPRQAQEEQHLVEGGVGALLQGAGEIGDEGVAQEAKGLCHAEGGEDVGRGDEERGGGAEEQPFSPDSLAVLRFYGEGALFSLAAIFGQKNSSFAYGCGER